MNQQNIKIILCETSHPGNIGAVARAMKNMGLYQLTLVSPARFPDPDAVQRASGAVDVLHTATVVSTLEEASANCQWLFGTSARSRSFPWPHLTPKLAAQKIVPRSHQDQIAIVFGTEQAGLSNEQLQLCDYHITIPTHCAYSSLNIAAAVQVIVYEIFQESLRSITRSAPPKACTGFTKATRREIQGLLSQFEATALALGFIDPAQPKKLLPRIKRLFAKSQLEFEEINILRGFLKAVQQHVENTQ